MSESMTPEYIQGDPSDHICKESINYSTFKVNSKI